MNSPPYYDHLSRHLDFPGIRPALAVTFVTFVLIFTLNHFQPLPGIDAALLTSIALILPALVYVFRTGLSPSRVFRLQRISPGIILLSMAIGLAVAVISNAIDQISSVFFSMPDDFRSFIDAWLIAETTGELIAQFLALVVATAICEEFLFRGFLQGALEQRHHPVLAIILSSLIFSGLHFNPWWLASILFASLIIGTLACLTGSVYPGIIVHAVNNGLALMTANIFSEQENRALDLILLDPIVVTGHVLLLGGILLRLIRNRILQDMTPDETA